MSRLKELIQELCPDGVEYNTIGECCIVSAGGDVPKNNFSKTYTKQYSIPIISNGIAENSIYGYTDIAKISEPAVTIAARGTIGYAEYRDYPYFPIIRLLSIIPQNTKYLDTKFLYYVLQGKKYRVPATGIPQLTAPNLKKEVICIPPLEVQCEIVRILDTFMELTEELTEELTARRKQYDYYRDSLLTFSDDVPKIKLCDLFYTKNGYTPSKSCSEYWESHDVPWFRIEDIRENGRILNDAIQHVSFSALKGDPFPENSIIVSTSATIGEHALIKCKSLSNQRFTYLIIKDEYKKNFDIKFLFYYCFKLDAYCHNCLNHGNFSSVDMVKFSKFEFPLISIDKQRRIVSILDRFDALCNDLTSGLPAEIEARRKQYEYYRDKLLSFPPAEKGEES